MRNQFYRALATSLALSCVAPLPALAQEGASPANTAAPSSAPAPVAPPPVDDGPDDGLRFRFGVALEFDTIASSADEVGLGVGLGLRLGLQFNQWFGIYYQPRGIVGGWVGGEAAGVLATVLNSAMFELTFPFFHIGLGPSIDVLSVAGCTGDTTNVACASGSDVFFGVDMRLALVLGSFGPGSNGGFSINLHPHLTFVDSEVVAIVALGFGGELY